MNGSDSPIRCGIPRLIKIASSITATRIIGSVILFSTIAMIIKIATIEIAFTT